MNDEIMTVSLTVELCLFINSHLSNYKPGALCGFPLEMCPKHRNVRREIPRLWLSLESDNGVRS